MRRPRSARRSSTSGRRNAEDPARPGGVATPRPAGQERGVPALRPELAAPGADEGLSLFASHVPAPETRSFDNTTVLTVFFDRDRFFLDSRNDAAVRRLARHLRRLDNPTVTVFGHASTEGTLRHNQELSSNRRELVRALLQEDHPFPLTIGGAARGELEPAVPETGSGATLEERRARNRRVEIVVTGEPWQISPEAEEEEGAPPAGVPVPTLEDLLRIFPPPEPETRLDPFDPRIEEALREREAERHSIGETLDRGLDSILDQFGIRNPVARDLVRRAARAGATEALDRAIDSIGLDSEAGEALKQGIRGIIRQEF